MILSSPEAIEAFTGRGLWGHLPADQVLQNTASDFPDKIALRDASNRRHWTSGNPRELTYRALDNEANQISRFLMALGAEPGMVAVAQLPPTTDAMTFFFGAWRAGIIVVPVSMTENLADIKEIIECSGARILVTCARFNGAETGIRMRDAAAECFNVRYPLGIGPELPEGLISIEDAIHEFDETAITAAERPRLTDPANRIATLTCDVDTKTGERLFFPRSHNQWLCSAWSHIMETDLKNGLVIGTFMGVCNLAGLSTGLLSALLTNGTLQFEFGQSISGMTRAIKNGTHQTLVIPGSLLQHIPGNAFEYVDNISAIWPKTHVSADLADAVDAPCTIHDVTVFGEAGLSVSQRVKGEKPGGIPLSLNTDMSANAGPSFIRTELKGLKTTALEASGAAAGGGVLGGELLLSGPMVCDEPFPFFPPEDYETVDKIATDIACRLTSWSPACFVPVGFLNDFPLVGSSTIKADEILRFVKAFEDISDANIIAIDEQLLGKRLVLQIEPRDRFSFRPEIFDEFLSRLLRTDADLISLVDTPAANVSTFHEEAGDRATRQAHLKASIEARIKEIQAAAG